MLPCSRLDLLGGDMHPDLEFYVRRAADEVRAANRAQHPKAAAAQRQLADEYAELIKCDGDMRLYRMLRDERELVAGAEPASSRLSKAPDAVRHAARAGHAAITALPATSSATKERAAPGMVEPL